MKEFLKSFLTAFCIALVVTGGTTGLTYYINNHGGLSDGYLTFLFAINLLLPLVNIGLGIAAMLKQRKSYAYGWLAIAALQLLVYNTLIH